MTDAPGRFGAPSTRPSRRDRRRWSRSLAALVAAGLLLVACGGAADQDGDLAGTGDEGTASDRLNVAVASFDIAVGEQRRILAGLLSDERELLAHGEVTFQLGHLGDAAGGEAELTQEATARFLGIPGMEPEGQEDTPRFLQGDPGNGVYAARVDLDRPGNWGLRVIAELADGRVLEGQAIFPVLEEPQVPTVGDPAPRTRNATIADVDAGTFAPASLDSRAGGSDATIPDPHLHDTVIADVLDAGEPLVVSIATPVYCVSRFCGPLTNVMSELALDHEDVAHFVQLEVWKDHAEQEANEAAAEWILTDSGGNEPWVFVVGRDGTIIARWDNVLDVAELEAVLSQL